MQNKIASTFTIYGLSVDEGECLNRLVSILRSIKKTKREPDKFPELLYGAVELRYAIEGTIQFYALWITGRELRNFTNEWKTKRLRSVLLKHDKKFFSKLHIGMLIARHQYSIEIVEPHFNEIHRLNGRLHEFLHAPKKF